ncbi:MAG: DUF1640 domain-containing protein [Nitrospirae bacterium]|nr:DUF1640 domain-containing protein [Nitrospirota bacterium]MBF0541914.1 DUF1640 domain-containing protein [Nitrospirota bacterium]
METILDTLKLYEDLKGAFTDEQAHKLSDVLKEVEKSRIDALATKADIARIEGQITLLRWMLGFVLAVNVSIALKIFFMH